MIFTNEFNLIRMMIAMTEIRRAEISDIEHLFKLINVYAEQEIVLPRSKESLYQSISSIFVAIVEGKVVGTGSLAILDKELAEVRTLIVDPTMEKKGIGKLLVQRIIEETKRLGIDKLITLTYQADFFKKCGFEITVKDNMPQKVWKDCINCPKLHQCDEIAMIIYVNEKIIS